MTHTLCKWHHSDKHFTQNPTCMLRKWSYYLKDPQNQFQYQCRFIKFSCKIRTRTTLWFTDSYFLLFYSHMVKMEAWQGLYFLLFKMSVMVLYICLRIYWWNGGMSNMACKMMIKRTASVSFTLTHSLTPTHHTPQSLCMWPICWESSVM